MIEQMISHYKVLDKPGEGGPNYAKASLGEPNYARASLGGLARRSFIHFKVEIFL